MGQVDKIITKVINENIDRIKRESIKENLRKKLKPSLNENDNVMKRFYGIKSNNHKPMMVEHITLNRIIKKHGSEGFISISANRSNLPQEVNDKNTQELINDIKQSGYSYLPTYGGYRNVESGEDEEYEPSFLIFNNNSSNNFDVSDFSELEELGKMLCGKYNQDCFLCKRPDYPAIYLDREGNKVNSTESDKVWKNDDNQAFFSTLHTPEEDTKFGIGRRWTHDINFEYVNPIPCTLSERMRRRGEIMLY